jgi:hypothetical protein
VTGLNRKTPENPPIDSEEGQFDFLKYQCMSPTILGALLRVVLGCVTFYEAFKENYQSTGTTINHYLQYVAEHRIHQDALCHMLNSEEIKCRHAVYPVIHRDVKINMGKLHGKPGYGELYLSGTDAILATFGPVVVIQRPSHEVEVFEAVPFESHYPAAPHSHVLELRPLRGGKTFLVEAGGLGDHGLTEVRHGEVFFGHWIPSRMSLPAPSQSDAPKRQATSPEPGAPKRPAIAPVS